MKHSDKIFFVVALLVFGASCGFYFYSTPELEKNKARVSSLLNESPMGEVWKDVVVKEFKPVSVEWPEVRSQDDDGKWFFQVFTPPQIWVDKSGEFLTESPYIKEVARLKFAFSYDGVSNEPYPIKYKGYYGTIKSPRIEFINENTKLAFSGRLNEEIVIPEPSTGKPINLGLTVKSFDLKRVTNPTNGVISQVATIVLFDKKLGKDIKIESDKITVLEDERRMTLSAGDKKWHVKNVGESMEYKGAKYIIKSIDMNAGSAIVEMIPDDAKIDKQTMKLSAVGVENIDAKKQK